MPLSAPEKASWPKSIGAVFAGLIAIVVLSFGTDHVFHTLGVYPPWGKPMFATAPLLLATAYRIAYGIVGGYVTARLAPHAPVGHALVLGGVGTVLSALGAAASIPAGLAPAWFPILLVLTALPSAWLGGRLCLRRSGKADSRASAAF
ncbi:MAG: hypothetical protein EA425_12615 [Puniceicoccaceae bacterium]|nr:MAG: hypothetical protein EA425_12615 [Puniceicoccaceae bacterium]